MEKAEGKRSLEKKVYTERIQEGNFEICLIGIGRKSVDQMHGADEGDKWRHLENAAKNPLGFCVNFLTCSRFVSFQKKTSDLLSCSVRC